MRTPGAVDIEEQHPLMVDEDPEVEEIEQDCPFADEDMGKVGRVDLSQVTGL